MKKLLMIAIAASLSITALAVPGTLPPPVTTGGTGNQSTTEVRITANVVQGIAVNEASPIDFGNLARSFYTGIVNQNVPGRIHLKGPGNAVVNVKLDKLATDLIWTGANGTTDPNVATANKDTITNVTVHGLTTTDTPITLGVSGEATRILTASFTAGEGAADNLGSNQKLGSYVGTVVVTATIPGAIVP